MGKDNKKPTESKTMNNQEANSRYVRELIRNQFSIIHHTENQISNFAKIAAILLGLASLFGLPQTLVNPSNAMMAGAASSLVILSIICVAVIVYALLNIGGWFVKFKMSPTLSLWWHVDNRLDGIVGKKIAESILETVTEDLMQKVDIQTEEIEYKREVATLAILYARAQDQARIARRIRYVLMTGVGMSFSFFLGFMLGQIDNEVIRFVMVVIAPVVIVILIIILIVGTYYQKQKVKNKDIQDSRVLEKQL